MPTSLVGQVDAAIGGKTGIDIPQGKNLVGAFHWPARVVIDEPLLETLPERERRQGMAELVKTRLLAASRRARRRAAPPPTRRRSACRIRTTAGARRWLNLGHTFAHALEAAADFDLPHGEAVALGPARGAPALRPRHRPRSSASLHRSRSRVDRERAWAGAPARQEARPATRSTSSCSATTARYVEARPADEVRRELERLIA